MNPSFLKSKYGVAFQISLVYGAFYIYGTELWKKRALEIKGNIPENNMKDVKITKKQLDETPLLSPQVSKDIFEKNAASYDDEIKWDEFVMGINLIRRLLIRNAQGKVLEVGCGTGRNLKYYYPSKVSSLTLLDNSTLMLEQCKKKADIDRNQLKIDFMESDICRSDIPDNSYDTIVDTFGICSVGPSFEECDEGPIKALNEMARICKEDGAILLLEHGKSSYTFLNKILDNNVLSHFKRWGCIWNRDIIHLIERSNMEVVYSSRIHFGTTYYIICKPKKGNTIIEKDI